MLTLVSMVFSLFLLSVPIAKAEGSATTGSNPPYTDKTYSPAAAHGFEKSSQPPFFSFLLPNFFTDESPFLGEKPGDGSYTEVSSEVPMEDEGVRPGDEEVYGESVPRKGRSVDKFTLSKSKLSFKKFNWNEWVQSRSASRSMSLVAPVPFLNLPTADKVDQPGLLSSESMVFFWYFGRRF